LSDGPAGTVAPSELPYFASSGAAPDWIVWQFAYVVATRVLFMWVYSNSGRSLFAVAVLHTTFNQVWQAFPNGGGLVGMSVPSFYNPLNLAVTTIALAVSVAVLWGPRTLAKWRIAAATRPHATLTAKEI
jgi:hypothetical protein